MTIEKIMLLKKILLILIPVLFGFLVYLILSKEKKEKKEQFAEIVLAKSRLLTKFYKSNFWTKRSDKIKYFLSAYGANFLFGRIINPYEYVLWVICFGLLFSSFPLLLFERVELPYLVMSFGSFIIGCFVPGRILRISNETDNTKMLKDIKRIYDTMRIQSTAGNYITTSLSECYLGTKNKRLKIALWEMTNSVLVKNDLEAALKEFNVKFKNKYIDIFVVTIEQSLKSGREVQLLSDVSDQLLDVERAINATVKKKMELKIALFGFLIFLGVIAIIVLSTVTEISTATRNF